MNKYFFTFGVGHLFKHKYLVLEAPDEESARLKMRDCFGCNKEGYVNFCSVYTETEWEQNNLETKYGYTKLEY